MTTTITLLGTGTSTGVPVIGCDCPVCQSGDPYNHRTRSSLYLSTPEGKLLVDTGPDLRFQALRENVRQVDSVFYTHSHLDHLAGFDELRAFCWRRSQPLPIYASQETHHVLAAMFPWAFASTQKNPGYVQPEAIVFHDYQPISWHQLRITPLPVVHAGVETHGFRFDFPHGKSLAYLCDVKSIPPATLEHLSDVHTLIIDGLRHTPHPTHMNLQEATSVAQTLRPAQTWLTHITHDLDYQKTRKELSPQIDLAYDGLKLNWELEPCQTSSPSYLSPSVQARRAAP